MHGFPGIIPTSLLRIKREIYVYFFAQFIDSTNKDPCVGVIFRNPCNVKNGNPRKRTLLNGYTALQCKYGRGSQK